MNTLEDNPFMPGNCAASFFATVINWGKAAVSVAIDNAEQFLRHVLDGDGQGSAVTGD